MTSQDDKYWNSIVGKLRRAQGMCPLTPEEAEAAFDSAPDMPLSDEQIRRMTEAAMSGALLEGGLDDDKPWDESEYENLPEESLQIFRNEGEPDTDVEGREGELEDKMLNGDESEEDGMEEGTEPPERSK